MSSTFYTETDFFIKPKGYKTIGMRNYLKEIRLREGLSQEELADKIGVEQATVQRHEAGTRKINLPKLRAYANALGCHPSDITDGPASTIIAKTEDEKKLLETYRGLSDKEQERFINMTEAYAADNDE